MGKMNEELRSVSAACDYNYKIKKRGYFVFISWKYVLSTSDFSIKKSWTESNIQFY